MSDGLTESVRGTSEPSLQFPADDYYESPPVETHTETTEIKSLLTGDGIRFIFTSAVSNFTNFGVVGVILVAMIGVGLGITRERVRQLESRALRELRMVAPGLEFYLRS